MSKSPLQLVKEKFGDEDRKAAKKKLIESIEAFAQSEELWLGRTNRDKGLAHVSNSKLLRLHATFSHVKSSFGSRAKLIEEICKLEKRSKDEGYKTKLSAYPVPRLFDLYKASSGRKKASEASSKK